MKRLGIYGGTFSPPHLGHVRAARAFLETAGLDELIIMPTFLPPHKEIDGEADADERYRMCELAFSELPNTSVSDFEIKKGGKSYTYLTLSEFSDGETELYFLVGTDMFLTLDSWRCPETIFRLATIALVRREDDGATAAMIEEKAEEYIRLFGARLLFIDTVATEISSSELREAIKSGSDTEKYLSPAVASYIKSNLIYKSDFTDEELSELREAVKCRMSRDRYLHTLGVEKAAALIADFCLPRARSEARAAALLHDVAKELGREEQRAMLSFGVSLSDTDLKSEKLYHAFAAPIVIKRDFPEYATKNVLSAAFNHTTGDDGMSLFDEIIFVSDYIEEGREYPECKRAREELLVALGQDVKENVQALHKCALAELESTKAHIEGLGAELNPRTERALRYIKSLIV